MCVVDAEANECIVWFLAPPGVCCSRTLPSLCLDQL